jgi:hypothetical protein
MEFPLLQIQRTFPIRKYALNNVLLFKKSFYRVFICVFWNWMKMCVTVQWMFKKVLSPTILWYSKKWHACGGPSISLQYTVPLVQWVNHCFPSRGSALRVPENARTHNGTRFLLLALSRYTGDPDMIDHWPCPRLRVDNGKLHLALCQRCEKPAVITHAFPSSIPLLAGPPPLWWRGSYVRSSFADGFKIMYRSIFLLPLSYLIHTH